MEIETCSNDGGFWAVNKQGIWFRACSGCLDCITPTPWKIIDIPSNVPPMIHVSHAKVMYTDLRLQFREVTASDSWNLKFLIPRVSEDEIALLKSAHEREMLKADERFHFRQWEKFQLISIRYIK